jgi:branched-chain amino acid transport system substrate-binding protein
VRVRGVRRWRMMPVAVVVLLVAAGCTASAAAGQATPPEPVLIGQETPKTGQLAPVGKEQRQGFDLYLDLHGHKLGGHPVRLKQVDDSLDPRVGSKIATGLVEDDKVDAVTGIAGSPVLLAIKDMVDKNHVPVVSSNAGAAMKGGDYIWSASYVTGSRDQLLGTYMAKSVRSVYIIAPDFVSGRLIAGDFKKGYQAAGGKIAGESYPPLTETKFTQALTAARESGAKAIFAFNAGATAVALLAAYAASGLKDQGVALYGDGALTEGTGLLPAVGKAAVGVYTVANYSPTLDNDQNRTFVSEYQRRYNTPPSEFVMMAYDAAALLDGALATVKGEVTPEKIQKGIAQLGMIDSPRGSWLFNSEQRPVQPVYLRQVRLDGSVYSNVVLDQLGIV